MQQLPLDLQVRPTRIDGDFIISACNKIAAQWVDQWPEWTGQFRALNIAGQEASGKSHLAAVWQAVSGAVVLNPFTDALPDLGESQCFILDDVDPSWSEEGLFHLFNHTANCGGSLLFLSAQPVGQLGWQLPDLASRMRAVNMTLIEGPDDALLQALLQKNFSERQLVAPGNVVQYLVARMERSFAAARDVVARMDRLSLANKSEISLTLARRVMNFDENTE